MIFNLSCHSSLRPLLLLPVAGVHHKYGIVNAAQIERMTLRSGRKMMRRVVVVVSFLLQFAGTFSHVFTFYHRRLLFASHRRLSITSSVAIYSTAHYPRYCKLHAGRCDRRAIAVMDMPFLLESCQFAIAYRLPQHCLPSTLPVDRRLRLPHRPLLACSRLVA